MWDYANDAELYYEKAVHHFASKCFDKWTKLEAHHSLTIVFFCRTFYPNINKQNIPSISNKNMQQQLLQQQQNTSTTASSNNNNNNNNTNTWAKRTNSINVDSEGRIYEDVFQVVVENESLTDWNTLIVRLKKTIVNE